MANGCEYTIPGENPISEQEFKKRLLDGEFDEHIKDFIKVPPTEGGSDELPFGKQSTTGISHEVRQARTYDTDSRAPDRGEGVTVEDSINHGQKLLKDGRDPNEVAKKFAEDPDKNISYNAMSLVRAQNRVNVKATDAASEQFGRNSKEYKEALDRENKWYNETVKPMQTEWSKIGQAQQGLEDIDTGSFEGVRRSVEKRTGKEITVEQTKIAKEHVKKIKELSDQVEKLKVQLTDALNKGEKAEKGKSTKEKAKDLANRLREKAKLSRPGSFSAATPASVVWDGAVETVAKAIEAGGTIAEAIENGLKYIRESDWYKGLNDEEKKKSEDEFTAWHEKLSEGEMTPEEKKAAQRIKSLETELANLRNFKIKERYEKREPTDKEKELSKQIKDEKENLKSISERYRAITQFSDKTGNKFTNEEAKGIWDYAKENYLYKGEDFGAMISKTGRDLGLTNDQVRHALATPKGAKVITNEMYKKQYQRTQAINRAKEWVNQSNKSPVVKALKAIPNMLFGLKVFGHGTVGMVTHAGGNIFRPKGWSRYWPAFFQQFKNLKVSEYQKALEDHVNDKDYWFWKKAGLAIDPAIKSDDYSMFSKYFGKLGNIGDRGFFALKMYRLAEAKALYESLSDSEKAHPDTVKEIAQIVNHATGTAKIPLPEAANVAFFAPRLEVSRWNRVFVEPAKALGTFTNWKNATPAEKVAAKVTAQRVSTMFGVYLGALATNQALLSLTGSKNNINFLDPTKSDWLKFKAGDATIDPTGGILSLISFVAGMSVLSTEKEKLLPKGQKRWDAMKSKLGDYSSSKLSPFVSTIKDFATQHDFEGNTMPFSSDKIAAGKKKLTWGEYVLNQQTPIPVSEYNRVVDKEAKDSGHISPDLSDRLNGLLAAILVGGTGVKIGNEPAEKPSPFTEEDKKDQRVSWIYKDWKMELPNTISSSEEITNEDKATKIMLDKLSPDVQEKYKKTHKNNLFDILQDVHSNGTVYVKKYKDEKGNPKNEVSLNPPSGDYDEVKLSDLGEEERKQVLSLSQKLATTRTKQELFNTD